MKPFLGTDGHTFSWSRTGNLQQATETSYTQRKMTPLLRHIATRSLQPGIGGIEATLDAPTEEVGVPNAHWLSFSSLAHNRADSLFFIALDFCCSLEDFNISIKMDNTTLSSQLSHKLYCNDGRRACDQQHAAGLRGKVPIGGRGTSLMDGVEMQSCWETSSPRHLSAQVTTQVVHERRMARGEKTVLTNFFLATGGLVVSGKSTEIFSISLG